MSLAPGQKLGPYEIVAPLGAGGMGEVYRARDKRLERRVAVKVLPAEVSGNAERKQRFEREARTISSLNHPNICALYDVGNQDGIEYLVLEYVEGETLEKRLEKGPLPTDVLLRYGAEIADALEKAHRSGVIHRDLKPANIMLTKSGAKLLDFGLAKWSAVGTSEEETLKTLTEGAPKLTEQGTILGTFQYMAPEQLEGKEADARTDVFALGEVLYEMATARQAFAGKTKASLIAAILSAEPTPIATLQPMTPPALERLVRGCLEKDPDERWQTAHDVKLQLRALAEGRSQEGIAAPVVVRRKNRERLLLAALAGTAMVAALLGFLYLRPPVKLRVVRSSVRAMENSTFLLAGVPSGLALSPDGLRLVYVARDSTNNKLQLWVRPLDSLQAQPLSGTEGAFFPFWSPDSQSIGFFAGGKLKRIEAAGGPPIAICEAPIPRGGTWSQDGVILFSPSVNSPIHRVSATGGVATPVTSLELSKNETTHRWPHFLRDGRHFLYVAGTPLLPKESSTNSIMMGSLDSKESKFLLHTHADALYASGHILFLRLNTLMAQPFDVRHLELTGDAFPIADPVQENDVTLRSIVSVSQNGLLAYLGGTGANNRELNVLDRNGKKVNQVPGLEGYNTPRISPDGKRFVYTQLSPTYDIWIYDISRGVKTRLTFGSASGLANLDPVWSPDGKRVAYTSLRAGKYGFYVKPADGSGSEEVLYEGNENIRYLNDWSPDGKLLSFQQVVQGVNGVWLLPLNGEGKPLPREGAPAYGFASAFSPDGKWLAYCSNQSGEQQVYVEPFPASGGKWQVSTAGGCYPRWRRDAKELFYLSGDDRMMAAAVSANRSGLTIGAVTPLFEASVYRSIMGAYDVSGDGQHFVVPYELGQPNAAITLVENWDAELKKK